MGKLIYDYRWRLTAKAYLYLIYCRVLYAFGIVVITVFGAGILYNGLPAQSDIIHWIPQVMIGMGIYASAHFLYGLFTLSAQRLRGADRTDELAWLWTVPLVNIAFITYLCFLPNAAGVEEEMQVGKLFQSPEEAEEPEEDFEESEDSDEAAESEDGLTPEEEIALYWEIPDHSTPPGMFVIVMLQIAYIISLFFRLSFHDFALQFGPWMVRDDALKWFAAAIILLLVANIVGIVRESRWSATLIIATAVLDSVLLIANLAYLYADTDLLAQYNASSSMGGSWWSIAFETAVIVGYYAWVIWYVLQRRKLVTPENTLPL